MLHLASDQLCIDLLDPVADRARLGPRFCWGGFIWQVHDRQAGPLLTGPEWPNPTPAPHNGQGLPESFRHSTTAGQPLLWNGVDGLAPGAGALGHDTTGAVVVTEHAVWQIDVQPQRAAFRTAQSVAAWSYELERTIELDHRQIRSVSKLTNRGPTPLVLEWFAHPFFALAEGRARVSVPAGTGLPENRGFALTDGEITLRRAFAGSDDGHLEHLTLPAGQPFATRLSHPHLTHLQFATSFIPFKCVLWANGNTLSLEPFLALSLAPGETRQWSLRYEFGERLP